MKIHLEIDGRPVSAEPARLDRRKRHDLKVRITDAEGKPVSVLPDSIACETSDGRRITGPRWNSTYADFSFDDRWWGRIECCYDGSVKAEAVFFGNFAGLLLTVFISLATVLPLIGLAAIDSFIKFDPTLDQWKVFFLNAFKYTSIGVSAFVGIDVLKQLPAARSTSPILAVLTNPLGILSVLCSMTFVAFVLWARDSVYCNLANSEISMAEGLVWKLNELWMLSKADGVVKPPLCWSREPGGTCRPTERQKLGFDLIARNKVGCVPWWPEVQVVQGGDGGTAVDLRVEDPKLSGGCRSAVAEHDGITIELAHRDDERTAAAFESIVFDHGDLRLGGDRSAPWPKTGRIEWLSPSPAFPLRLELGPGVALSKSAELRRVSVELEGGDRLVPLPVMPGHVLQVDVSEGIPGGAKLGELRCRVDAHQRIVVFDAPPASVEYATLFDGYSRISSWRSEGHGFRTILAFCVGEDASATERLRLEIKFLSDWQPELSWSLQIPPRVARVDLRLGSGAHLGSAVISDPQRDECDGAGERDGAGRWLASHYVDSPSHRPIKAVDSMSVEGDSWFRAIEEPGVFGHWFWLARPVCDDGGRPRCSGDFGSGVQRFDCPPGERTTYPGKVCYFTASGAAAGECKNPENATSDQRRWVIREKAHGCAMVYVCRN